MRTAHSFVIFGFLVLLAFIQAESETESVDDSLKDDEISRFKPNPQTQAIVIKPSNSKPKPVEHHYYYSNNNNKKPSRNQNYGQSYPQYSPHSYGQSYPFIYPPYYPSNHYYPYPYPTQAPITLPTVPTTPTVAPTPAPSVCSPLIVLNFQNCLLEISLESLITCIRRVLTAIGCPLVTIGRKTPVEEISDYGPEIGYPPYLLEYKKK